MELKTFVVQDEYYNVKPEILIRLIDLNFKAAMEQKMSRFDVQWGMWSAAMNRMSRKNRKEQKFSPRKLNDAFNYWQAKSRLLDLYHMCGGRPGLIYKMKISKERKYIQKLKRVSPLWE